MVGSSPFVNHLKKYLEPALAAYRGTGCPSGHVVLVLEPSGADANVHVYSMPFADAATALRESYPDDADIEGCITHMSRPAGDGTVWIFAALNDISAFGCVRFEWRKYLLKTCN